MDDYAAHTPTDHEEDPYVLAQNYICGPFAETESVIKGVVIVIYKYKYTYVGGILYSCPFDVCTGDRIRLPCTTKCPHCVY